MGNGKEFGNIEMDLKVVHPIKDWITQYLENKLEDIE